MLGCRLMVIIEVFYQWFRLLGSSKYYKWEMGIRMRGNLEFLESWADENGFIEECVKHLEKITALANLLATPRSQIMKVGSRDIE